MAYWIFFGPPDQCPTFPHSVPHPGCLTCMRYIRALSFGFRLGLANGRDEQEIRGWKKDEGRAVIPPPPLAANLQLPLQPSGPRKCSLRLPLQALGWKISPLLLVPTYFTILCWFPLTLPTSLKIFRLLNSPSLPSLSGSSVCFQNLKDTCSIDSICKTLSFLDFYKKNALTQSSYPCSNWLVVGWLEGNLIGRTNKTQSHLPLGFLIHAHMSRQLAVAPFSSPALLSSPTPPVSHRDQLTYNVLHLGLLVTLFSSPSGPLIPSDLSRNSPKQRHFFP